MSKIDTARGASLAAKEKVAREYFAKQYVDEGGGARTAGRANRMASYWAKQSELDSQLHKLYGQGQARAMTGLERQTKHRLTQNRERLGLPPQFGMPTMMPPRDTQGQMFNTLMAGVSIASLFLPSDVRVKEDIEQVDVSPQGYKVYEFNYKNDTTNTRYRGVMAQDVVNINPMAVHIRDDGYFAVDYDKLDVDMEVVY